jgi:hypothetical protein
MSAITPKEAVFGIPPHKKVILNLTRYFAWLRQFKTRGEYQDEGLSILAFRAFAGAGIIVFITAGVAAIILGLMWLFEHNGWVIFAWAGVALLLLLVGATLMRILEFP